MIKLLRDTEISDKVPQPTVSAVVVICKSKYPYTRAHAAGEIRLKGAKRVGKQRLLDIEQPCSVLDFEVVRGGRLVSELPKGKVRPTLRPYFIINESEEWGLPVKQLIDQRWNLRACPPKRLSELKALYDTPYLPQDLYSDELNRWKKKMKYLVNRLKQREPQSQGSAVEAALGSLGSNEQGYWRQVSRYGENWYGHGLPDLLDAWDFALSLDKSRSGYEEG